MHDSFCAHSFSTFALIPAGAIKVHWRNRTIMIFYYTRFCHWRQKSLQIATDDPDYNHNTSGFGDQNHCLKHRLNMGDATMQSSRFSTGGSLLGAGGAGQSHFDEQSFEAYRNRGSGGREEVIEIYALAT